MNGEGYVGSPASALLREFGITIYEAFGDFPYLVGSALVKSDWRDVDVRLILSDDEYERQIGKMVAPRYRNLRWNALCIAFTALGVQMTGLPIDFQIDQQTWANETFPKKPRGALGVALEMARNEDVRTTAWHDGYGAAANFLEHAKVGPPDAKAHWKNAAAAIRLELAKRGRA